MIEGMLTFWWMIHASYCSRAGIVSRSKAWWYANISPGIIPFSMNIESAPAQWFSIAAGSVILKSKGDKSLCRALPFLANWPSEKLMPGSFISVNSRTDVTFNSPVSALPLHFIWRLCNMIRNLCCGYWFKSIRKFSAISATRHSKYSKLCLFCWYRKITCCRRCSRNSGKAWISRRGVQSPPRRRNVIFTWP